MGKLSCLSVNDGDIAISFDTQDAAEAIRAKRIITDMLKRGYALLVKTEDGSYTRARKFDEKAGEYVIADFDNANEKEEKANDKNQAEERAGAQTENTWVKGGRVQNRKGKTKRVKMESAETVAVAPSAGG